MTQKNDNLFQYLLDQATEHIEEILDHFGVKYSKRSTYIVGTCPVHGSSRPTSLGIPTVGKFKGLWKCWTKHCEDEYGKTILHFICRLIQNKTNQPATINDVRKFLSEFLGLDLQSDEINKATVSLHQKKFVYAVESLQETETRTVKQVTRDEIRKLLDIPAEYYINRGYDPSTLKTFDVGLWRRVGHRLSNRVIVPLYDDSGKYFIGCQARSIYEKCDKCQYHHDQNHSCPVTKQDKLLGAKWLTNSNFSISHHLFNYWNAVEHIKKTHTVILTEGIGDCLRLYEAGVYNSVAIFGSFLSKEQQILLEKTEALNLVVLTDTDEAGMKSRNKISNQCARLYNVYSIDIPTNDVGDMSVEQIKRVVLPHLEGV